MKQNVGKKSQGEMQTITDDMGAGLECKAWVESEVTLFRLSPARDKKFGKFQMCVRCESARDAIINAARQLEWDVKHGPAPPSWHEDELQCWLERLSV